MPFVSASCLPHQVDALREAGYVDLYILKDGKIFRRMYLSHGREITLEVKALPVKPGAATPSTVQPLIQEDLSKFLPGGRIPLQMFYQIRAFFKEVCEKHGQALEAHCYIMYNSETGYYIHVPEQTVSGGTVEFSYEGLNSNDCIVVDIHSHGSMSAFFSGTDDTNDRRHIYFSGVIGKVNTPRPEMTFRFNMYDLKKAATLPDIFQEVAETVTVPEEWLAQVKKRQVGTTYTPGSWVGQGATRPGGTNTQNPGGTAEDEYWNNWGKRVGLPREEYPLVVARPGNAGDQKKTNLSGADGGTTISATAPEEHVSVKHQASDYIACQYGPRSKELYETVMDGISSLEGEDEILKEVLAHTFQSLSSRGQESIQTFGIH